MRFKPSMYNKNEQPNSITVEQHDHTEGLGRK